MSEEPFVIPDDLAAHTGQPAPANAGDLLAGISEAIRRRCRWHIWPATDSTLTIDGPGGDLLSLPTMQLNSIASITEDGEVLVVADLEWSHLGDIRKSSCWTAKFRGIVATINHGYEDVPDLRQVVLDIAARAASSPSGATREQAGQVAISYALTAPGISGGVALLANEMAIIDQYRLREA